MTGKHRSPFDDSPGAFVLFWAGWAAGLFWPLLLPGLVLQMAVQGLWVALLATGLARWFRRKRL